MVSVIIIKSLFVKLKSRASVEYATDKVKFLRPLSPILFLSIVEPPFFMLSLYLCFNGTWQPGLATYRKLLILCVTLADIELN